MYKQILINAERTADAKIDRINAAAEAAESAGISPRAIEYAASEARISARLAVWRNAELTIRDFAPQTGKAGAGHKAWRKALNEASEECEYAYQSRSGVHDYLSANDLMFAPSDLRDGSHHDMRRNTQASREAEYARAVAFIRQYVA